MNTRLAIIRSEGKEHLCYREEECFVDVSYPMVTFTKGEDDFEIAKCDHPSMEETFLYQESRLSIVIEMYHNGWPASIQHQQFHPQLEQPNISLPCSHQSPLHIPANLVC